MDKQTPRKQRTTPRVYTQAEIDALHGRDYPTTMDLGHGQTAHLYFDLADDGEPISLAACYVCGVECAALLGEQRCEELTNEAARDWQRQGEWSALDNRIPSEMY